MATFSGRRVSAAWKTVLDEAVRDGISFQLNSGQRTMGEQQALYDQNMSGGSPRPGRPLTAVPNGNAPHIRVGRANHALDVDMYAKDGEQALQNWLVKQGLGAVNNVPGEGWHIDVPDESQLLSLARKIRKERSRIRRLRKQLKRQIARLRARLKRLK